MSHFSHCMAAFFLFIFHRYKAQNGHVHTNRANGYHQNGFDDQFQPPTSSHFYATSTNVYKKNLNIDHNSISFGYHNDHHLHDNFYKLNGSNKQNNLHSSSHIHNRSNLFQSISSQSTTDGVVNSSAVVASGQNTATRPTTSRPISPSPSVTSDKPGDPQVNIIQTT